MGILTGILNSLLILTSLFLICLVLIQRGKGGGLAGAFGGVGGSSAFGTKAGDVFTKVTMGVAGLWIVLNMLLVILANQRSDSAWGNDAGTRVTKEAPKVPGGKVATGTGATSPSKGAGTATGSAPAAPTSSAPAPASGPVDVPAIPTPPPPPPSAK